MRTYCRIYYILLFLYLLPLLAQAKYMSHSHFSNNKDGVSLIPFRTDSFIPHTYARRFADSEMHRFPRAWELDHGRRLYFGYAQGVGCCAMLAMWKATDDCRYFDYVEQWADTLIDDRGDIFLYDMSTYNLDFINSGKILFVDNN